MSYQPKKRKPVGPFRIIPMRGRYRVIDGGDGSIILPKEFKSSAAAQRWIDGRMQTCA